VVSKLSSSSSLLFDLSSLERKEVGRERRFCSGGVLVFSEELADEACEAAFATSWRHRSMRWDLEGRLLLIVVEGCHAVRCRLRCGRAMLERL
jgi:hypothetical protein